MSCNSFLVGFSSAKGKCAVHLDINVIINSVNLSFFIFSLSPGFCCEHAKKKKKKKIATLSRQRDFAHKDCIVGFQHQQIIRAFGKRSKHITSAADICGEKSFSLASSARPYWRLYQYLFSISAHRAFTFG